MENVTCSDPFDCIFGMYGQKKRRWGCFARFPDGKGPPEEEDHGCIAKQVGAVLRKANEIIDEYDRRWKPVPAEIEGGNTTYWNVCGECHSIINQGDKFCHECGRPVIWDG